VPEGAQVHAALTQLLVRCLQVLADMPNSNGRNKGMNSNGSSNGTNSGSPGSSSDGGSGHNPRELLLDLDLWTDTGFPTAVAVAVMACVKGGWGLSPCL
jgi:hypothetical protein